MFQCDGYTVGLFPILTCAYIVLQVSLWNPLTFIISNVSSHFLSADLCKIDGDNPIVESIEHTHQSQVHPGCGLYPKYQVQSEEGGHHGDIAEYSDEVANLVNEQEPLIHKSWCCPLDWFLKRTFSD